MIESIEMKIFVKILGNKLRVTEFDDNLNFFFIQSDELAEFYEQFSFLLVFYLLFHYVSEFAVNILLKGWLSAE